MYSSWRTCQEQVSSFSNNNYEGFETFDEVPQKYSNSLKQEKGDEVGNLMLADEVLVQMPNQVQPSRIKDFIIVVLLLVDCEAPAILNDSDQLF